MCLDRTIQRDKSATPSMDKFGTQHPTKLRKDSRQRRSHRHNLTRKVSTKVRGPRAFPKPMEAGIRGPALHTEVTPGFTICKLTPTKKLAIHTTVTVIQGSQKLASLENISGQECGQISTVADLLSKNTIPSPTKTKLQFLPRHPMEAKGTVQVHDHTQLIKSPTKLVTPLNKHGRSHTRNTEIKHGELGKGGKLVRGSTNRTMIPESHKTMVNSWGSRKPESKIKAR